MAGTTPVSTTAAPTPVSRAIDGLTRWFPLAILAGLWELASGRAVAESILPPPSRVFVRLLEMIVSGDLLGALVLSAFRVAMGLSLAIAIGVLLGIGMARSATVEDFFDVFLAMLYPVPKTALVPLALLWLGRGTQTAILIIFLACLLPIILNSYNAALAIDQHTIWSARMMGTTDRRILWKIVIPSTIPQIVTGIRQAIPIAFIALTGAELIGASDGIGAIILTAGQLGTYPRMFGAIVTISATAFFTLRAFDRFERRVFEWT